MMSFFSVHPYHPVSLSGVVNNVSERGRYDISSMLIPQVLDRLPTDPVGTFMLSLTNLILGSTYDVEVLTTGEKIVSGTAETTSLSIFIPVYPAGNPRNELRIKIRKASSSPYYQPFETQASAAIGTQSIFINQLLDE